LILDGAIGLQKLEPEALGILQPAIEFRGRSIGSKNQPAVAQRIGALFGKREFIEIDGSGEPVVL